MWIPSPHQIPQILSEPMTDCNQNFEYNFSNFGVEAEMKISTQKSYFCSFEMPGTSYNDL